MQIKRNIAQIIKGRIWEYLQTGKRLDDVGDGEEGDQLGGVGRVDRDPAQEADEEDDPRWERLGVQPGALSKDYV